jgi:hypothetical protein
MTDSNSSSNPPSSRVTLKLKGAARKTPQESKASAMPPSHATPPSQSKSNSKPGAHWSDEHKKRMQADMDELTSK